MVVKYLKYDYISLEGQKNLKNFKYNGINVSILYKYFLSDFAQGIVNQMPIWLAPNLITMIGYVIFLSAVMFHLIYNPHLDQLIPSWLCYYSALCIFLYQTLDNCDGKQARRTGTASPLGMLFDHGADCVVQWLIGLIIMSLIRIGQHNLTFIAWVLVGQLSFYFGIYQQQHTGIFKLGEINGVDEGLPTIQFFFIISGFFGPQIWLQSIPFTNFPLNSALMWFFVFVGSYQIVEFALPAVRKLKEIKPILVSLTLPFTYLTTIGLISYTGSKGLNDNTVIVMIILGFSWSKIITILQVSLLTKDSFSQLHFSWLFVQASTVISLAVEFRDDKTRQILLQILLIYSVFTYLQCVSNLIHQLTVVLGIRVFHIKQKINL